jgi:hypothetical protein
MDWYAPSPMSPSASAAFMRPSAPVCAKSPLRCDCQPEVSTFAPVSAASPSPAKSSCITRSSTCMSRSPRRADTGILIRTRRGRRDYIGGANYFAPLSLLDDIPALAERIVALTGDPPGAIQAA